VVFARENIPYGRRLVGKGNLRVERLEIVGKLVGGIFGVFTGYYGKS